VNTVFASNEETIRIQQHPPLLLEDRRGHRSVLVATHYLTDYQTWCYELRDEQATRMVSDITGYHLLGHASPAPSSSPSATSDGITLVHRTEPKILSDASKDQQRLMGYWPSRCPS
jgi:hypothetical protein